MAKVQMDTSKPANIQVWNNDNSASLVSSGTLVINGKTFSGKELGSSKLVEMIAGESVFQEAIDEIPEAIQIAMKRDSIKSNK